MRIILDSNRYTDLCRGIADVVQTLQKVELIFLPLIVLAELRAGFAHGNQREKNEKTLGKFLKVDGVQVLIPDEQTTYFYADLYAYLRKKGRPIPTNDLWIASLALQHNLSLYDRDSDFDHIPNLKRL